MKVEKDFLLIPTAGFKLLRPKLIQAAELIREAINNGRPIVVSHHNDTDGYAAGFLLENAITAGIKFKHGEPRYMNNFFMRNASRTPYYDFGDASKDVGVFLQNANRNNSQPPLLIIADNGSTLQDLPSIQKVKLFGADVIVVDHHDPGNVEDGKSAVCKETLAHVNPHLVGLGKDFSASMLCFQLAYYINAHHHVSYEMAALGGVADHCAGETIQGFIEKSELSRDYIEELYYVTEYELFLNRYPNAFGVLTTLLQGPKDKREALLELYKPVIDKEKEGVVHAIEYYKEENQIGNTVARFIDAESITLWGDYFSIGKLAGIAQSINNDVGVTVCYSNQVIVFRANEQSGFDTNVLLQELKTKLPYARITGGGHNVAGSIKFLQAAKNEILEHIKSYIKLL